MNTNDSLLSGLATLGAEAPQNLADKVIARWVRVPAPTGPIFVASTDHGIAFVRTSEVVDDDPDVFAESFRERFARPVLPAAKPPTGLVPALRSGRTAKLRFDLRGLTDFQRSVLQAASEIPRGELRPYGWIAGRIGRPRAVRAVGSALGHNPVPLLIPCHRVTLSDGRLGEYVMGPVVKERLIRAENTNVDEVLELGKAHVHYLASDTTGVVCFPTCVNARRITPGHRHRFRTLQQATGVGYSLCKHCLPA